MILISHFASLHTLVIQKSRDESGHVQLEEKTLLPGMNEVSDDFWQEAGKNKITQHHVSEGKLEVQAGDLRELKAFKNEEAIKIVRNTIVRELLEQWEGTETRGPVRTAIRAQLDNIAPAPAKAGQD